MVPTPSPRSDDPRPFVLSDDHPVQESSQRRPRFIRAITSPVPGLREPSLAVVDASSSTSCSSSSTKPTAPSTQVASSSSTTSVAFLHQESSTRPKRPQLHPVQSDQQHPSTEVQPRSFSTSTLPPFLSVSSTTGGTLTSSHSHGSITETIKDHRWPKGLKFLISGFNSSNSGSFNNSGHQHQHSVSQDDRLSSSSLASTSSSSSSRSSHKSMQRRKSEGTTLRISKTDQTSDSSTGSSSFSIAGRSFARGIRHGTDSSIDQLHINDARTRRISDSGLGTSRFSGGAFAERLQGFAQTVRGLSRSPFSGGQSSPMTSSSSSSTPTTPGFSPQCSFDSKLSVDHRPACHSTAQQQVYPTEYESWDDFLHHYCRGHFPADRPLARPRCGTFPPPQPPYCDGDSDDKRLPYFAAPPPPNEEQRLRALYSFQILQTGTDLNFERIVQLVSTVMGVKGCMIALVDNDKIWIKAHQAVVPQDFPRTDETYPRKASFCTHTILRSPDDPLIVLDSAADWRFQNLPCVTGEPHIRFYAGAPLTSSNGFNIGSLCLLDMEPRTQFTDKEKALLIDFAAVVMREMELWNDQVQLCIRNRMMRDVTRWVRGCLDLSTNDNASFQEESETTMAHVGATPFSTVDMASQPLPTPSDGSLSPSAITTSPPSLLAGETSHTSSTLPSSHSQADPALPTPSGSPTLLSWSHGTRISNNVPKIPSTITGNPLQDKAFPEACNMIQTTLNVDAVYLVQATSNRSMFMPTSPNAYNYWDPAARRKGSIGVVRTQDLDNIPNTVFKCLASSRKTSEMLKRPLMDEKVHQVRRQGSSWVCTDEGCRPHRLGDSLVNAIEPTWDRDIPAIKEMLGYVRQEIPVPTHLSGQDELFSCSQGSDVIESDWFGSSTNVDAFKDPSKRKLLCHTFQGTLPLLMTGATTPYKSCAIVPILGPPVANPIIPSDDQPWAYFVILSASQTKLFSFHERIYLKNFGSCLITEVMKRRVEAADEAKGTFIKSISHELRTPMHIILGILELLNTEEALTEKGRKWISIAEASGKSLVGTISNVIDLAKLDPDNSMDSRSYRTDRDSIPTPSPDDSEFAEVDIRELCEHVAGTTAKEWADKNVPIVTTWTKPSLSSLSNVSTSAPNSSPASTGPQSHVHAQALLSSARSLPFGEESMNGYSSSVDSPTTLSGHGQPKADEKATVELLVSLDNTFREDDQDARWTYSMDVKNVTSILSQLVENAIKFTKSGYVEVSAVSSPTNLRLKPPVPDAQAIVFTVRDTGKGISSDYVQTSLFNRFTQEDPLAVGTGLGLALVKLRVERLGGWLEISSEGIEGKGCEVKVLIWATKSMSRPSRSLREISGSWQQKSCRFYVGASSVATNKLWDTMALGMMQQQLNMTVVRGNERETSAEAMLRDVSDSAQCDLLVINDDITRLKTYLAHWAEGEEDEDEPRPDGPEEGEEIEAPTPLLILVSEDNAKIVRRLVDEYLQTQAETKAAERPATIVIMPKPIGPLKLAQCLRDCFTPAVVGGGFQSRQGSPSLLPKHLPFPLIRASTVPHITTAALGVHSNQMMSAGGVIKSTFVFPTSGYDGDLRGPMMMLPPHSPGGLVLPPRYLSIGTCSNSMAEHEGCPSHQHQHYYYHHHHHHQHHPPSSDESVEDYCSHEPRYYPMYSTLKANGIGSASGAAEATDAAAAENKDKPEGDGDGNQSGPSNQASVPKKRFQRSIRNFASQRHLRKTSISNGGSPSSPSSSALSSPSFARSTGGDSVQSSPTIPEQSLLSDHQSVPRVLIVEDNDTNRMILKTFLKKRGVGVVEAENGQLGVERFQEEVLRRHGRQGFEVVLMDLQMPVMDGNLATKRIREFEQMMVKQHGLSLPQAAGMNQVTSAGSSGAGGHPGEESGSSSNSKEETEGDVDEATETTEAKLGNGVTMAGTSGHRCNFDGRGYRPTVIYALTGLAGDEDKRLAYDCGVDDYLTKPVSLKTLGSLLAKHLTIPLS